MIGTLLVIDYNNFVSPNSNKLLHYTLFLQVLSHLHLYVLNLHPMDHLNSFAYGAPLINHHRTVIISDKNHVLNQPLFLNFALDYLSDNPIFNWILSRFINGRFNI